MTQLFVRLAQYFSSHRTVCWLSMVALFAFFGYFATQIHLEEDINKLMPSSKNEDGSTKLAFADLKIKDKVFLLLEGKNADMLIETCDAFVDSLLAQDKDSVVGDIFYRLDEDLLHDAVDYIIAHLPAYVDTTAYAHFDSLLTRSHLERQMQQNRHGGEYISVVVNNAGIRRNSVLALMPESDWHRVLDVTLSGFYNVTQPLLPAMQLHKFGRIVNMASVSGLKGLPGQTNYSAAKGGIIAATKALAQEVARRNITVNAIAPGFIKTDMTEGLDEEALKQQIPMRRFGTPQEVADAIAFLVSPQAGYITGNVISINGGLYT